MPTTKTTRFDAIAIGTEFTFEASPAPVVMLDGDNGIMVKKTNSSAIVRDYANSKSYTIRACERVLLSIPDPTPEELAAKEAETLAWTKKWYRGRLASEIEMCEVRFAKFAERMKNNPYDAFEWGTDTAVCAGKHRAFLALANCFDIAEEKGENGYEAANAFALRRVVDGARCPQHSTSPMSNLVKESEIAGFAEFVSLK